MVNKNIQLDIDNFNETLLRNYIIKIYSYMASSLAITCGIALLIVSYEPITKLFFTVLDDNVIILTGIGIFFIFAPLMFSIYFFWNFNSITTKNALVLLCIYAALVGASLAPIGIIYTGESIARTCFICCLLFTSMSFYGYSTKRDLTSIGSLCAMGLIGLLLTSIVNLLLQSTKIHYITSVIGIFIFIGLIAWDTQKIKAIFYSTTDEAKQKMAIIAALALYLDIINLFLYLLRFLGREKRINK